MTEVPTACTATHPAAIECTRTGDDSPPVNHDYRIHIIGPERARTTVLRCVFCHVIACGKAIETDPCIEPTQHKVDHRTVLGVVWPVGTARPRQGAAIPR